MKDTIYKCYFCYQWCREEAMQQVDVGGSYFHQTVWGCNKCVEEIDKRSQGSNVITSNVIKGEGS